MIEVAEDLETVGENLVRLLAVHVGDEADAAGIVFEPRIVEALFARAETLVLLAAPGCAALRVRLF